MICDLKQSDDSELLLYSLDFNKPTIERALEITAEYVSKYRLILTGGTAIDMALRSKGERIYDDNALPDYDIISNHNLKHATTLAEILCNEGIKEINVITAIHITTIRVRIKNITLLDATYLPESLMEKIPYLDIGKFRLVHPDYQKIDQRLSLSKLMADTGVSLNIFNRMIKDIKRNKILREVFALDNSQISDLKIFTHRVSIPIKILEQQEERINNLNENCFVYTGDICSSGYLSYALFYNEFIKSNKPINGTIDPNINITKDSIEFDIPIGMALSFLNCANNITDTLNNLTKQIEPKSNPRIRMFNALANTKPITISKYYKEYNIEISDSYGSRISAIHFELNGKKIVSTSIDYTLMQLLRDRVFTKTDNLRSINSLYYESLLKMMLLMQESSKSSKIWFPSINCYGITDLPEYKAFALEKILDPEAAKLYKPKNSYLRIPQCMTKSDFDSSISHYFAIDGEENENIKHTNLKWIVDSIADLKLTKI